MVNCVLEILKLFCSVIGVTLMRTCIHSVREEIVRIGNGHFVLSCVLLLIIWIGSNLHLVKNDCAALSLALIVIVSYCTKHSYSKLHLVIRVRSILEKRLFSPKDNGSHVIGAGCMAALDAEHYLQ